MSIPEKEQKQEPNKEVKNISNLYRQKPGSVTCNHCDYFFIPTNDHRCNCPGCFKSYITCPRCKKMFEGK